MLQFDKKTILYFEDKWTKKIKVFFYDSWCSWKKVDLSDDFDLTNDLEKLDLPYTFSVYVEKLDKDKFENCMITRTVKADHTGKEKIRYIFTSSDIKDRCGCGTSFSFEKKKPKIDLNKLKNLKKNFNWSN